MPKKKTELIYFGINTHLAWIYNAFTLPYVILGLQMKILSIYSSHQNMTFSVNLINFRQSKPNPSKLRYAYLKNVYKFDTCFDRVCKSPCRAYFYISKYLKWWPIYKRTLGNNFFSSKDIFRGSSRGGQP